jgi:hypothetical protein
MPLAGLERPPFRSEWSGNLVLHRVVGRPPYRESSCAIDPIQPAAMSGWPTCRRFCKVPEQDFTAIHKADSMVVVVNPQTEEGHKMDTQSILAVVSEEIARLEQVKALLNAGAGRAPATSFPFGCGVERGC